MAGVHLVGMKAAVTWLLVAPVAGVCAQGTALSLDGATVGPCGLQTDVTRLAGGRVAGSELTEGDGTLVGRKSLGLGTGPIDPLVSVAQSNLMRSRGTGLAAALAVGDGAGCGVPLSGSRAP
jgi:hypothetical protein